MKDPGEANKILSMEISRDKKRNKVSLTSKEYMKKVLHHFVIFEKSKPVNTPLAPYFKISASLSPCTDEERRYVTSFLF